VRNNYNPSLRDIGGLIFLLYKSIQQTTFHSLEAEEKIALIKNDFFGINPKMKVVGDVSNRDKNIRGIIQYVLQGTLNNSGNKQLLNSNHPVVNCENFDAVPQSRYHEILDIKDFTLQDRIELARFGVETGSCYTCARDRNPFDEQEKIKVYRKSDPHPPECFLHTANADTKAHAKIKLSVRIIGGEILYNGLTIITSSVDLRERLNLEIQSNFSKHKGLGIFLDSIQDETEPNLSASSIVLDLGSAAQRRNIGYIAALRKAGFEPLVVAGSGSFHNGEANIIRVLTEFIRNVTYFWNPLFFLRPTELLQIRSFQEQDIPQLEGVSEDKPNPAFWPLKCIKTTGKMLENIIAGARVSSSLDPTLSKNLFLEISDDEKLTSNQLEFVLDEITMWMC
jgi:hypothetical protein